jgi:hypothetical protein
MMSSIINGITSKNLLTLTDKKILVIKVVSKIKRPNISLAVNVNSVCWVSISDISSDKNSSKGTLKCQVQNLV